MVNRTELLSRLIDLQYKRNDVGFGRGTFRVRGDTVELFPAHLEDRAWRISLFGDELESIFEIDPLTGEKLMALQTVKIYPNSHYVTPKPTLHQAIKEIQHDLKVRLAEFEAEGKLLEAQRLEQRTQFDIEMMLATGSCAGIENYSRYLSGRKPGEPPPTLFEYLPDNALLIVDESHVMVPQVGGMYRGDFMRKSTLSDFGFRLPSCKDNRPLKFEEWDAMRPQIRLRLGHPRPVGDGAHRRRLRRAGRPPDRPDRPAGDHPPDRNPGGRPARRVQGVRRQGPARAGHDPDQEDGRGADRIHARGRHPGPLHSFRCRNIGADRDHPRPAPWRLRRADRHQPAARGSGHPRMRPCRDPRRRQGRLSAVAHLADPDHRPRRPQHRRPGDPLRRQDDQQHQRGDRGNQPPPRKAEDLQRGQRHHAGNASASRSPTSWRASTSAATASR